MQAIPLLIAVAPQASPDGIAPTCVSPSHNYPGEVWWVAFAQSDNVFWPMSPSTSDCLVPSRYLGPERFRPTGCPACALRVGLPTSGPPTCDSSRHPNLQGFHLAQLHQRPMVCPAAPCQRPNICHVQGTYLIHTPPPRPRSPKRRLGETSRTSWLSDIGIPQRARLSAARAPPRLSRNCRAVPARCS